VASRNRKKLAELRRVLESESSHAAAVATAAFSSTSVASTRAPSRANASEISRPSPDPAPVTIAILSRNCIGVLVFPCDLRGRPGRRRRMQESFKPSLRDSDGA